MTRITTQRMPTKIRCGLVIIAIGFFSLISWQYSNYDNHFPVEENLVSQNQVPSEFRRCASNNECTAVDIPFWPQQTSLPGQKYKCFDAAINIKKKTQFQKWLILQTAPKIHCDYGGEVVDCRGSESGAGVCSACGWGEDFCP